MQQNNDNGNGLWRADAISKQIAFGDPEGGRQQLIRQLTALMDPKTSDEVKANALQFAFNLICDDEGVDIFWPTVADHLDEIFQGFNQSMIRHMQALVFRRVVKAQLVELSPAQRDVLTGLAADPSVLVSRAAQEALRHL